MFHRRAVAPGPGRAGADHRRPAGARACHRPADGPSGAGGLPARQASAHACRGRADPAHPSADGRPMAGLSDGERCTGGPGHQIRAVLGNAEWTAVGYRLPVLELLPTTAEAEVVGHLGPDLLGPDWSVEEALRRLAAAPERPTGEALLDQRNLAGIGNVYAKKLCRACGLTVRQGLSHPLETVTSSHRSGRRPTLRPGPVGRSRWPLARTNGSGGVGAGSMTAPARISSWRSGPPPPPASTAPRRQRCRTASSSRRSA